MTKKFGIIGNPIKHSLSPVLHNYWFEKYKIDASYSLIEVKDDYIIQHHLWSDILTYELLNDLKLKSLFNCAS